MSVLIVEDSRVTAATLTRILNQEGIRDVVHVVSVEEALPLIEWDRFELVLAEWMLPGRSGLEFVRALRRSEVNGSVPAIVFAERNDAEDVLEAVEAGADSYIVKPFEQETLRTKVRKLMQN